MAHLGDGLNGYLDVENATLRAPRLEAVSNIGIANTSPEHAFSVGSNLYVSINSPDVLTVDGNVVCEGIKVGLIEILPSYDLAAVSNVGNVTQSTIQFANTTTAFVTSATIALGGHIIPTVDSAYDIGSTTYKIRDMYVSDNSLWIGDQTKIAFENGKMKFKRRKLDKVPKVIRELAIAQADNGVTDATTAGEAAVTYIIEHFPSDGIATVADLKLQHWKAYTESIDPTKEISDIFVDDDEDYEAQSAAEAFVEVGSDISTAHKVTIGGTAAPRAELDVVGTGSIVVPGGTTGQRPANPVSGMVRFNTTIYQYEAWGTANWLPLSIIDSPPLFSFSSFTFTRAGQVGRLGPSLATITGHSDYSSASWRNNPDHFNQVSGKQGFQLWTVPVDGTYRITAKGAQGGETRGQAGNAAKHPGYGAHVGADFLLTKSTKLVIIVGQMGDNLNQSTGAVTYMGTGGGGASWVLKPGSPVSENQPDAPFTAINDIYLIAGGGGGGPATYSSNGTNANGTSNGSSSSGGTGTGTHGPGTGAGYSSDGSGINSFYGSGYPNPTIYSGGSCPRNGAMGGMAGYDPPSTISASYDNPGGFGGGGGSGAPNPGGGGGYGGGVAPFYTGTASDHPGEKASTSYIQLDTLERVSGTAVFSGNHTDDHGSVHIELLPI